MASRTCLMTAQASLSEYVPELQEWRIPFATILSKSSPPDTYSMTKYIVSLVSRISSRPMMFGCSTLERIATSLSTLFVFLIFDFGRTLIAKMVPSFTLVARYTEAKAPLESQNGSLLRSNHLRDGVFGSKLCIKIGKRIELSIKKAISPSTSSSPSLRERQPERQIFASWYFSEYLLNNPDGWKDLLSERSFQKGKLPKSSQNIYCCETVISSVTLTSSLTVVFGCCADSTSSGSSPKVVRFVFVNISPRTSPPHFFDLHDPMNASLSDSVQ